MNIWSKLGVSVALVALFCIVMLEAFQNKSYYDTYKWYICGVFLVLGAILTFVGRGLNQSRRARYLAQKENEAEENSGEDEQQEQGVDVTEPFLFANMAYWGVMLVAFGVSIIFIVPTYNKTQGVVAAREVKKTNAPIVTNVVTITNAVVVEPRPPTIKLQGIVFREPKSSVLINGRTFFIGDSYEDAQLLEINPTNVVFEWKGKRIFVHRPD